MNNNNNNKTNPVGLAALCLAIIEGYAQGKSGVDDDMVQRLINLGDCAEDVMRQETRLQTLERAARALMDALQRMGFGDESAEISGADVVDTVNEHLPALREALAG